VRRGDWKLVVKEEGCASELYDLRRDVGEKHDLAAREPGKVAELRALFDRWNAANRPQTFPPKQQRRT